MKPPLKHLFRQLPFTAATLIAAVLVARAPLSAHHSWEAEFDDKKPTTLKGVVTKYEWTNPHVMLFMDVATRGDVTNWMCEFASVSELKSAGWTRDSVKVGDNIT